MFILSLNYHKMIFFNKHNHFPTIANANSVVSPKQPTENRKSRKV